MALYSRGKARQSLIDTVAYRAVSQIATMVGYVVMVRGMTEAEFGVFSLLYAFVPVVSTIASLGLEQVLRRYQPEYLQSGKTEAAAWLVRFVASSRFGANVVLLSVILLAWNYAAPLFKLTPYRAEFAIFSLLILLHFQARILQLSLAAHMLHRYSVGSMGILSLGKLIGYSLLAWQGALTLERAILVDVLAYSISYGFLRAAYNRHCKPSGSVEEFRPDPTERKRLLRYGIYNNFNDAGSLVLSSKSDNFFIAAFIDPLSVGVYAFYTRLNEMLNSLQPVRLFENVVQPLFFSIKRIDADTMLPRYFSLLLNLSLIPQWPILAYVTAYHAEIVTVIFGGKFLDYSWMLPLVMAFSTFNVVAVPVTLVAQYEEKAGAILLSKIFAVYNILALLALLPLAGLYGAAVATGSAAMMKNTFIWWHVRHRARWTNGLPALAAALVLWGGVVGTCYAIRMVLAGPALLHLFIGAAVCGLAALIHVRSAAISKSDRAILGSVLRGKEGRLFRMIGLLTPAKGS